MVARLGRVLRCFKSFYIRFAIFLLCLDGFVVKLDAAPNISEIRRSLEDFHGRLDSIRVDFEVRFSTNFNLSDVEDKPAQIWTWIRSGRKQLFENEPNSDSDLKQFVRVWMSFDGTTGYVLTYHRHDNKILRMIEETPYEPERFATAQFIQCVLGSLPLHSRTKESVVSLLRKSVDPIVEEESIDGIHCLKVRLGQIPSVISDGPPHEVVVWFSDAHDYLPKRISVFPVIESPPELKGVIQLPPGSMPDIVDVLEYRQIPDALFKTSRWFPQRIQHRTAFSHQIDIKSVVLNEPVSAEAFVPAKPFGTEIRRWSRGSAKSQTSYIGGEKGEKLFNERLRMEEGVKLKPTAELASGVDASPVHSSSWSIWFAAGSLLLLGLAIVAAKQRVG